MVPLWQELDLSFEEEWACNGDSGRYKMKLKLESEKVFKFLIGLNPKLDEVGGRVLDRGPVPSTRVFKH